MYYHDDDEFISGNNWKELPDGTRVRRKDKGKTRVLDYNARYGAFYEAEFNKNTNANFKQSRYEEYQPTPADRQLVLVDNNNNNNNNNYGDPERIGYLDDNQQQPQDDDNDMIIHHGVQQQQPFQLTTVPTREEAFWNTEDEDSITDAQALPVPLSMEELNERLKNFEYIEQQAKRAFMLKDWPEAILYYKQAVAQFEFLGLDEKDLVDFEVMRNMSESELNSFNKKRVICFNKVALAYKYLNKYNYVVTYATKSLLVSSKNERALYLRGQAYRELNECDKARNDIVAAIDLVTTSPTDAPLVTGAELEAELQRIDDRQLELKHNKGLPRAVSNPEITGTLPYNKDQLPSNNTNLVSNHHPTSPNHNNNRNTFTTPPRNYKTREEIEEEELQRAIMLSLQESQYDDMH